MGDRERDPVERRVNDLLNRIYDEGPDDLLSARPGPSQEILSIVRDLARERDEWMSHEEAAVTSAGRWQDDCEKAWDDLAAAREERDKAVGLAESFNEDLADAREEIAELRATVEALAPAWVGTADQSWIERLLDRTKALGSVTQERDALAESLSIRNGELATAREEIVRLEQVAEQKERDRLEAMAQRNDTQAELDDACVVIERLREALGDASSFAKWVWSQAKKMTARSKGDPHFAPLRDRAREIHKRAQKALGRKEER